jgi:predicted peptidase
VTDPATYSALLYTPPEQNDNTFPPLLVAIHGAGKNERDVWNLADIQGEHAGLIPSLIASGTAPQVLLDNFAVVAPYSQGKRSFYEEPRQKLLQFIDWVCSDAGQQAGCPKVDTNRIFLFGFSDGATEAVELLTTGQFRGGIVAAYGFTGTLPSRATDRLKDVPIWVFHSRDDVIFPVACSDRLVATLRENSSNDKDTVRYSRFDKDQEGFTGAVRGHSTGITASRSPQVYEWLLSL